MFGIDFFMKAMETLESKALRVHPLQCSRLRHQLSTCQRCSTYCPAGAISWKESLDIDADKCTGCGICANVCPNGVFEAENPTNRMLLKRVSEYLKVSKQISFACSKYQREDNSSAFKSGNVLTVPCLGRIDESVLIGCIALGANSVLLLTSQCHNCEYKSGSEVIHQTAATANKILTIFGISEKIVLSSILPEAETKESEITQSHPSNPDDERYSRRDFFRTIAQQSRKATLLAASSMVPTGNEDEKKNIRKSGLPFYLPQKRMLLLETMKMLPRPSYSNITMDNLPFYQLAINESCTGCGMCAYFCPTCALKKTEEDGKTSITFQLSHCIKCNLCREICYKGAISVLPDINPEKLLNNKEDVLCVTTKSEQTEL